MLHIVKNELVQSSGIIYIPLRSDYWLALGILRIGHFSKKKLEHIKR